MLAKKRLNISVENTGKILIGADFVPTESNRDLFINNSAEELFGTVLLQELNKADLTVFNLEAPITEAKEKLFKVGGPNLKVYPECINILRGLKPLLLSGANNHIFDYKDEGIRNTLNYLKTEGISYIGFGENSIHAREERIFTVNQFRVGFYSCSENEFCCANSQHGGGNGYDPLYTFDDIRKIKKNCDILIVLYHGGRENYRYPSPQLKKVCNKMVECGANLVICQHSHCIGCYEEIGEGVIIYGQGNLLFDYNSLETWKTSLIVQIEIENNEMAIYVIPLKKVGNKVRVAERDSAETIISDFLNRSEQIRQKDFLRNEWKKFLDRQKYILLMHGVMGINNRIILGIDKKVFGGFILKHCFKAKRKKLLLNYLRCESIRESIFTLLEDE